jgi:hypothetical protein
MEESQVNVIKSVQSSGRNEKKQSGMDQPSKKKNLLRTSVTILYTVGREATILLSCGAGAVISVYPVMNLLAAIGAESDSGSISIRTSFTPVTERAVFPKVSLRYALLCGILQ